MNMRACLPLALLIPVSWGILAEAARAAPQPNHPADPVAAARSKRDQARKDVDAAKVSLSQAKTKVDKAKAHVQEVRKKLEEEYTPELGAARKQLDEKRATLEQLKKPLLDKLEQQAEYRALLAAKTTASKQGQGKAFSDAAHKLTEVKQAALDGNSEVQAAQDAATASEAAVQALIKKRDEKLAQDKRDGEAVKELEKAQEAEKQAQQKAATAVKQAADADRALAAEEQKKHASDAKKKPPQKRK